jgi:hypothetical protein
MGIVTDNKDPREIGRVKFRVPEVGGQKIFAWAKVPMAVGGNQAGLFAAPTVDAQILVAFEANDINRPVIIGAWYPQVSEKSTIPGAAQHLGDDPVRDGRGEDTGTGAGGVQLEQPIDGAITEYPFNFVFKSPRAGHLIEIDDTQDGERISISHGPSKSWLEFQSDGTIVMGSKDKRYLVVEQSNQEHFKAAHDVLVDGAMTHKTVGAQTEEYADTAMITHTGDKTETLQANSTKTVTGTTTETLTGDVTKTLSGALSLTIASLVTLVMAAAATVSGTTIAISATVLTVTAGSIILGSSSGGLALMNENALALLNANIAINNGHLHTTTLPGAPTGPPTVPQIPLPNAPGVDKTQITKAL